MYGKDERRQKQRMLAYEVEENGDAEEGAKQSDRRIGLNEDDAGPRDKMGRQVARATRRMASGRWRSAIGLRRRHRRAVSGLCLEIRACWWMTKRRDGRERVVLYFTAE